MSAIAAGNVFAPKPVRVCAYCERELGPQALPVGALRSHGVCRRHLVEQSKPFGTIGFFQKLAAEPDSSFCPDLAEHPELLETNQQPTSSTHHGQGLPD